MIKYKYCSLCGGILGCRFIIRDNKRLCVRHYANEGLREGDKIILDYKIKAIATNDKIKNYNLLRERG